MSPPSGGHSAKVGERRLVNKPSLTLTAVWGTGSVERTPGIGVPGRPTDVRKVVSFPSQHGSTSYTAARPATPTLPFWQIGYYEIPIVTEGHRDRLFRGDHPGEGAL